jgi:hypothetical protein
VLAYELYGLLLKPMPADAMPRDQMQIAINAWAKPWFLSQKLVILARKVAAWLRFATDHYLGREPMLRVCLAGLLSLFVAVPVIAQQGPACAAKAVSKDGKPLAGAAKASSMKKCCEASAVGKDDKKLAGAAKASFMKKCEAGT